MFGSCHHLADGYCQLLCSALPCFQDLAFFGLPTTPGSPGSFNARSLVMFSGMKDDLMGFEKDMYCLERLPVNQPFQTVLHQGMRGHLSESQFHFL